MADILKEKKGSIGFSIKESTLERLKNLKDGENINRSAMVDELLIATLDALEKYPGPVKEGFKEILRRIENESANEDHPDTG